MSVDVTPWDEIEAFGNPWHGRMTAGGTLTLASGATLAGAKPQRGSPGIYDDTTRQHILVKFDGLPSAPTPTTYEAGMGMEWQNYAILVGENRHYNPLVNVGFGPGVWLYRAADGEVWAISPIYHTITLLRFMVKRLNVPSDPWQVGLEYLMPSGTVPPIPRPWPSPNGSLAVLPIMTGSPAIAYLTITVSGGGALTMPTISASKTMGIERNVTDDGAGHISREDFAGVRYLANGTKVEIWLGSEGWPNGSFKQWYWIGSTKHDIVTATYTIPSGLGRWDVVFDGNTYGWNITGPDQNAAYTSYLTEHCGVFSAITMPTLGANQHKSLYRGIAGQVRRFTGPPTTVQGTIVEHPLTGVIVDAWWLF